MLHVRRKSLQSVHRQLTQTAHILILRCEHADRLGLRRKVRTRARPLRRRWETRHIAKLTQKLCLQRKALLDHIHDRLAVKIGIRDRHKQIHRNAVIRLH